MLTISAAPILAELASAKMVVIDTETSSLYPWRDGNILAGLGVKTWRGTPFYMPVNHRGAWSQAPPEELHKVLVALRDSGCVVVMHHAKFDLAVCEQAGVDLSGLDALDTVVMARLVREDEKSYELKVLGRTMLNDPSAETEAKKLREYMRNAGYPGRYDYVPPHVMEPYVVQDLCLTEGLYTHCEPLIRERGLTDLLKLEMRLTRALYRSERRGVRLDRAFIEEEMGRAGEMLETLSTQLFEMAGEEFNPSSAPDVRRVFKKLGITSPTLTKKGGESFAKDAMAKIDHPIANVIVLWRSLEHNRTGYYSAFLAKGGVDEEGLPILHSEINQAGASTGRMSSRQPNVQNIVSTPAYEEDTGKIDLVADLKQVLSEGGDTRRFIQTVDPQTFNEAEAQSALNQELVRKVRGAFVPRDGNFFLFADYCVGPETLILTEDFRWVRADDVKVGDRLVGFEEEGHVVASRRERSFLPTVVEAVVRRSTSAYEIEFEDGRKVVASGEHRWLTSAPTQTTRRWRKTKNLHPGYKIKSLFVPQVVRDEYLAGFLDGEGWVSDGVLGFGQKEGPVLDEVLRRLKKHGLRTTKHTHSGGVVNVRLAGRSETMALMALTRPVRLLPKAARLWVGGSARCGGNAVIKNIRHIGNHCPVVSVRTSTGTFIAEGMFSHNSQVEIRSYAAYAGERDLLRVFDYGLDIHTATALAMHGSMPPAGTPEYDEMRRGAKGFSFGLIFGQGLAATAEKLGKTKDEAQAFRDAYFSRYPHAQEFAQWVEDTVRNPDRQDARGYGYLVNLWGRRYYLPPDKAYVGVNRLVQGSCADMLKHVYSNVSEMLVTEDYLTIPLIPIHDEIIYEMPFVEFEVAIPRVWDVMVDVPQFGTPLRVDLSWSPTRWSEKKSLACGTCSGVGKTSKLTGEEALDAIYRGEEDRLAQAELAVCVSCGGRGYDLSSIREHVASAV